MFDDELIKDAVEAAISKPNDGNVHIKDYVWKEDKPEPVGGADPYKETAKAQESHTEHMQATIGYKHSDTTDF